MGAGSSTPRDVHQVEPSGPGASAPPLDPARGDTPGQRAAAAASAAAGDEDAESGGPRSVRSLATTGLFILACLYTLYLAAEILIPITVALILFLILWPLVRLLTQLRIPEPLGAGIVVAGLLGAFGIGAFILADPAARWMAELPEVINQIQGKIRGPVEQLQKATQEVEQAIGGQSGARPGGSGTVPIPVEAKPQPPEAGSSPEVAAAQGFQIGLLDIVSAVAVSLRDAGWTAVVIFVLLYFLLATGEIYQEKIVKVLPTFHDKKQAVTIIRRVHRDVATYLLTVTVINCVLGGAIGVGLYLIGMPNAVLWGVMAALLNFVPYLGALTGELIVGVVGLTVFPDPIDALQPVGIYLAMNVIEAQFVTPAILGRRLTMNPVIVFLAVLFWGWLWGVIGALIAVPLLAILKVICDASDRLRPLSEFLGR